MRLRWSPAAANDLERIAICLQEQTPLHAKRLTMEIYKAAQSLTKFPRRGRPGRRVDTRELVVAPLPYVIVYRISDDAIHVVRILHGAQRGD